MTKTEALLAQIQALPDEEQQQLLDFAEFLAQKVRRQQETRCIKRYQQGEISVGKLGELLGLESRWDAEAFLQQHNIPLNYGEAELAQDLETIQRLEAAGTLKSS